MSKLLVLSFSIVVSLYSTIAKSQDCDISGIWEHSAKPAKLFVDLNTGNISVHSHENNAKAIGLVVIKNIEADADSSSWQAKMYSAAEDSFCRCSNNS